MSHIEQEFLCSNTQQASKNRKIMNDSNSSTESAPPPTGLSEFDIGLICGGRRCWPFRAFPSHVCICFARNNSVWRVFGVFCTCARLMASFFFFFLSHFCAFVCFCVCMQMVIALLIVCIVRAKRKKADRERAKRENQASVRQSHNSAESKSQRDTRAMTTGRHHHRHSQRHQQQQQQDRRHQQHHRGGGGAGQRDSQLRASLSTPAAMEATLKDQYHIAPPPENQQSALAVPSLVTQEVRKKKSRCLKFCFHFPRL